MGLGPLPFQTVCKLVISMDNCLSLELHISKIAITFFFQMKILWLIFTYIDKELHDPIVNSLTKSMGKIFINWPLNEH